MARIITFASSKGGTGKTMLVANLGVAMAQLGREVLILDADITMAGLGLMLGLEGQKPTLHEVLAGEARPWKAVYKGPKGVKVLPSGISLSGIKRARLERLRGVVKELAKKSDFLLIDSPSGLGQETFVALKLAQEVVLVVTPDIASLSNTLKTKTISERLGAKPIGVVINRMTGTRIDLSGDEISSVLELPILATVPEDSEVRRSVAFGEPVVAHSPKSPAAREIKKLASILLKRSAT